MLNVNSITLFRLKTLQCAVRMEVLGMTRRGRSATAIVKSELGLKRNLKPVEVLAVLDYALGKIDRGEA